MKSRKPDPVDLMLMGRMEEATKIYLDFYLEALESGDEFIAPELISQLHFSVAGQNPGTDPESMSKEVERLVIGALYERRIEIDRQIVTIHLEMAREKLLKDRAWSDKYIVAD